MARTYHVPKYSPLEYYSQFFASIQAKRVLWDPNCPGHDNKFLTDLWWKKVAYELNETKSGRDHEKDFETKKKIYHKYLTGKKSDWPYAKFMTFLNGTSPRYEEPIVPSSPDGQVHYLIKPPSPRETDPDNDNAMNYDTSAVSDYDNPSSLDNDNTQTTNDVTSSVTSSVIENVIESPPSMDYTYDPVRESHSRLSMEEAMFDIDPVMDDARLHPARGPSIVDVERSTSVDDHPEQLLQPVQPAAQPPLISAEDRQRILRQLFGANYQPPVDQSIGQYQSIPVDEQQQPLLNPLPSLEQLQQQPMQPSFPAASMSPFGLSSMFTPPATYTAPLPFAPFYFPAMTTMAPGAMPPLATPTPDRMVPSMFSGLGPMGAAPITPTQAPGAPSTMDATALLEAIIRNLGLPSTYFQALVLNPDQTPAPTPFSTPPLISALAPIPEPALTPISAPAPTPISDLAPIPEPAPIPISVLAPIPEPAPIPISTLAPIPEPALAPISAPAPTPIPALAAIPEPAPAPISIPAPISAPAPIPSLIPTPAPDVSVPDRSTTNQDDSSAPSTIRKTPLTPEDSAMEIQDMVEKVKDPEVLRRMYEEISKLPFMQRNPEEKGAQHIAKPARKRSDKKKSKKSTTPMTVRALWTDLTIRSKMLEQSDFELPEDMQAEIDVVELDSDSESAPVLYPAATPVLCPPLAPVLLPASAPIYCQAETPVRMEAEGRKPKAASRSRRSRAASVDSNGEVVIRRKRGRPPKPETILIREAAARAAAEACAVRDAALPIADAKMTSYSSRDAQITAYKATSPAPTSSSSSSGKSSRSSIPRRRYSPAPGY